MELENPVRIPDKMFFKIGEVAELAGLKAYVLRYWETEFPFLAPNKSNSQQRMYTRTDIENLLLVKHLLHDLKFSIEGARKRITELRRQGELAEARRMSIQLDAQRVEEAKQELHELIDLCAISN